MKIKKMVEKDLPMVYQMFEEVFNKEDEKLARNAFEYHFKAKKVGMDDGRRYWTAKVDGRIVGVIGIVITIKNQCWLSWYCVKKAYQKRGIGHALFQHALKMAKKLNVRYFYVETGTLPTFRQAIEIYKEYNFKPKFRIKDYWKKRDHLIVLSRKI